MPFTSQESWSSRTPPPAKGDERVVDWATMEEAIPMTGEAAGEPAGEAAGEDDETWGSWQP